MMEEPFTAEECQAMADAYYDNRIKEWANFRPEELLTRFTEIELLVEAGRQGSDMIPSGWQSIEGGLWDLTHQAAEHGLKCYWHRDTHTGTLEEMSEDERNWFAQSGYPNTDHVLHPPEVEEAAEQESIA